MFPVHSTSSKQSDMHADAHSRCAALHGGVRLPEHPAATGSHIMEPPNPQVLIVLAQGVLVLVYFIARYVSLVKARFLFGDKVDRAIQLTEQAHCASRSHGKVERLKDLVATGTASSKL